MKKLLLSVAVMATAIGSASAADPNHPSDWTGVYAGVVGGYGFGQGTSTSGANTTVVDVTGGVAGATLGVNAQFDQFVLGLEGDVMWAGLSGSTACTNPAFACNASSDWMGSVRGRAGVALDQVMLFATAGVAMSGFTASTTPASPGTTGTYSATYVGWTAGVGAEVAVADNISVKAEYTYADFGSQTAPAGTVDTVNSVLTPRVSAVKLGVNFAIDSPSSSAADTDYSSASNDWTGFYAGIVGGYGFGQGTSTSGANTTVVDATGGLAGATFGVNAQFDQFVLGLETDVVWAGLSGSTTCVGAPGFTCNSSADWMGSVRGRAGVAIDQVLLFATAGVAISGMNSTVSPVPAGITGNHRATLVGWTAGVGAEVAVTESIRVKAEYAYSDFGSTTAPIGTLSNVNASVLSPKVSTIKAGVNFAF